MPLVARGVEKRYYADGYWRDTSLPALLVGEHSGYLGMEGTIVLDCRATLEESPAADRQIR